MKKAIKFIITSLSLALLLAIFAFSASAADLNWDNNTSFDSSDYVIDQDTHITVTGEVSVPCRIIISNGAKVKINGGGTLKLTSSNLSFISVRGASSILTLENITIDANQNGRCICVEDAESFFVINDGAILKNGLGNDANGAGILNYGTVTMYGGLITGNNCLVTGYGAGLYNNGTKGKAVFYMYGGAISNNSSVQNGGGVANYRGGTFLLDGGIISGNSGTNGAAIMNTSTLILKSGTITDNKSTNGNNAGIHNSGGIIHYYSTALIDNNMNVSGSTEVEGININYTSATELHMYLVYDNSNIAQIGNWKSYTFNPSEKDTLSIAVVMGNRTNPGSINIAIDGEAELSAPLSLAEKVNLIGYNNSGDKINYVGTSSNRALTIDGGADVTLENITIDLSESTNTEGARGVVVRKNAKLTVRDGVLICGGKVNYGGGIYNQGTTAILGGKITGNVATLEGGGVYCCDGGVLTLGGNANITGNYYSNGAYSNICTDGTGNLTIEADFCGKAGFGAKVSAFGDNTTLFTVAILGDGYVFNGEQIISDDSYLSVSEDNQKLILTGRMGNVKINTLYGAENVATVLRETYKLTAIIAPDGYSENDFVGFVKVRDFGTAQVTAQALFSVGDRVTLEDIENTYAVWAKVETLAGASANISQNSGIKFITTVDSENLAKVGIKVKSSSSSGDGYYRGTLLGTSSIDQTKVLSKENYKQDVKLAITTWNTSMYKKYTGKEIGAGKDSFAVKINYGTDKYYNYAVSFRGYIEITVGGKSKVIYSDFVSPGTLVDGDNVTYAANSHGRSARAIIRKIYFSGAATEAQVKKAVGDYYPLLLQIGGYKAFPANALQLDYYLNPLERGGEITDQNEITHVAIWGDSFVTGYNMADIIKGLGESDSKKIEISSIGYNVLGVSGSLSLREFFKISNNSFVDANGNATTDYTKLVPNESLGYSGTYKYWLSNTSEPIDKLYILINREIYYAGTGTNATLEPIAAQAFVYNLQKVYPDMEVIFVAPPAYNSNDIRIGDSGWYRTSAVMVNALNNAVNKLANAVTSAMPNVNVRTYSLATCFANAQTDGIQLTASEISSKDNTTKLGRHPTMAGAYLAACLLFGDITDSCAMGCEVYGRLPRSEAQLLQEQAHDLSGCTRENHLHAAYQYSIVSGSNYNFINDGILPAEDKWNALKASVLAYDARGSWLQYDQKRMNRLHHSTNYEFRHEDTNSLSSPEDATPQHTLYTDCSNWITAAFYDTFGWSEFKAKDGCALMYNAMRPNSSNKITNMTNIFTWTDEDINDGRSLSATDIDGNFVAYVNGGTSPAVSITTREVAKEYFIKRLQPGDVILYIHYPKDGNDSFAYQGGHVMLYMGNGVFMHCSGDQEGGGGSDYRVESKSDLYEHCGGIQIDSMNLLLDENASRSLFGEAAVCILRPNYDNLTVTENAKARLEGLVGIVSHKETTAPEGVTVTSGDEVTFTFVVENRTNFIREISISDVASAGLTFVRGDGTVSGGKVSFEFELYPYETRKVSYTVKVTATSGTVAMDSAYINGVLMNKTDILVGNTLTSAQQTAFADYVRANKDNYNSAYALAGKVYSNMGKALTSTYATPAAALEAVFDQDSSAETSYTLNNTAAKNMLTGNFYGGQNLKKASGYRAKEIRSLNLVAGDLLLFVAKADAVSANTNFSKAQCYIYLGNGTLAGYDTSGQYYEVSGSEGADLIDSLLGEAVYFVARPSLAF